ncbi:BatA domain-containing protein [Fulvivirga sedimenti]|uniref:BatA domain-containing protein n=1 Tax=Fulvivirga sedimenti TaxID=2879465 RepID=A0A9X1HVN4_9BACT|nr:BatA domain-containing protein [Fulvivirga sedimenti]MCA6075317.1 BatA domain-containing protein [Fulvivirga sedimenti]MCA6076494.1 BatA domain-containing protein [Fulvivirga sedimenti]MCA6077622.1 BatA domain-containing protein [Fulvivirga sedimenti]
MSFQNPQLLFGLFALVIPILIHFFNFRKTRKVYFSNTRFLQKVKESTATRKRLKHYLILASRLLFIFFLVLAFAQPFLPAPESSSSGDPVFVYLDNSWSMSNEVDDGVPALDRSIGFLDELVRQFPPTTQYKLLTNDFLASSRTLKSAREMEELITEIEYSGVPRRMDEVLSRLEADTQGSSVNLFWLSDFQKATLGADVLNFDSSRQINIVPFEFSNDANAFVDSLYVENPLMITDEQVRLHVIFSKVGGSGSGEVIAKVYLDGVQSGTASVSLSANSRQELVFDLSVDRSRPHRGKIVFEEFPVTFDNEFNFVLNIPETIVVLDIKGGDAITPVELVYGNSDLFDLVSQPASNLDYNQIELSDLVIINGINVLDPPLATALNRYLGAGGTVMMIPGENISVESYRNLNGLGSLQLYDSMGLNTLSTPDYDNPFFDNVFEERNDRLQMPAAIPIVTSDIFREKILSFPDGKPFLSVRRGTGDIYLMSTPLSEAYGNFSRHALFVPVMYKVAVSGKSERNELYRYINRSSFSLKQDSTATNSLYKLIREDEEIIPQQRVDGNRIYFEVPRFTLSTGFYELYRDETFLGLVAFNTDPEESDIRQMNREEVVQAFQGKLVDVLSVDSQSDFAGVISEKFIGKTLWKEALMLALLFLLLEVLLIRFMP